MNIQIKQEVLDKNEKIKKEFCDENPDRNKVMVSKLMYSSEIKQKKFIF